MNSEYLFKKIEEYYNVTPQQLASPKRSHNLVELRQFFSYFLRQHTNYSLSTIGIALRRDHSTVINYLKKFDWYFETDEDYTKRYCDFVYLMKRDDNDTVTSKALAILELLESKTTLNERLDLVKNFIDNGV